MQDNISAALIIILCILIIILIIISVSYFISYSNEQYCENGLYSQPWFWICIILLILFTGGFGILILIIILIVNASSSCNKCSKTVVYDTSSLNKIQNKQIKMDRFKSDGKKLVVYKLDYPKVNPFDETKIFIDIKGKNNKNKFHVSEEILFSDINRENIIPDKISICEAINNDENIKSENVVDEDIILKILSDKGDIFNITLSNLNKEITVEILTIEKCECIIALTVTSTYPFEPIIFNRVSELN